MTITKFQNTDTFTVSSIENTDQLNGVNSGSNHVKDTNKRNSTNGNKHGGPVTPEPNISSKSVVYGDSSKTQILKIFKF